MLGLEISKSVSGVSRLYGPKCKLEYLSIYFTLAVYNRNRGFCERQRRGFEIEPAYFEATPGCLLLLKSVSGSFITVCGKTS